MFGHHQLTITMLSQDFPVFGRNGESPLPVQTDRIDAPEQLPDPLFPFPPTFSHLFAL